MLSHRTNRDRINNTTPCHGIVYSSIGLYIRWVLNLSLKYFTQTLDMWSPLIYIVQSNAHIRLNKWALHV